MDNYWGMEFVEVIDPKQPEGTRVDATTYALLSGTGYYENLKMQCYAEQFPNVFYQTIVVPVLNYLDVKGITPDVVAVTQPDDIRMPGLRDRIHVQVDDETFEFALRHDQLTDSRFPFHAIGNIANKVETRHWNERARYTYNTMSDSQRDYLHAVMKARGFDELDDLYFNQYFKSFCDSGLLIKFHGMYWMPSDDAIRMWQLSHAR